MGGSTPWGVKAEMIKKVLRYIITVYPQYGYPVFKEIKTPNACNADHQGYLGPVHEMQTNDE